MTKKSPVDEGALESSLRLALLKMGLVIPQTDAEVETFDRSVKTLSTPPEALSDPFACLDPNRVARPRIVASALQTGEYLSDSGENLAWAAREGREISAEIEALMRSDREKAEKDKNGGK
jgi:hypothetical protein